MKRKPRRFTPTTGAAICTLGLVLGFVAWQLAIRIQPLIPQILLLLFAWFALWFFSHDLTHHVVGKIGGISFEYYFLGRSAIRKLKLPLVPKLMNRIPVLVLKIDRSSLERASSRARKWMHASGAVVSMLLPWVIVPSIFAVTPYWVGASITLLILGNTLFTMYFSPKTGDLYRARLSGK